MSDFKILKAFVFFIVAAMSFEACSPREKIPGEFPDKDEMAEILADLYLSESVLDNRRYKVGSEKAEDIAPAYYKDVLDEYNLTTAEFDTIRKWYVAHPFHYQDVYDKVVLLITQREADLNKLVKAEEEASDSLPEVEDLWRLGRELAVNTEDTIDRRLPFSYPTDSLVGGKIRLSGFYRFLRPDMSKNATTEMITLYADSTADTISVELTKEFEKKPVTLVTEIDTLSPVIEVSGFLFRHDTSTSSAVEFTEIRLEHLGVEKDSVPDLEILKKDADVR
jgi:hypothetical protein